jgi:hypothetical protein
MFPIRFYEFVVSSLALVWCVVALATILGLGTHSLGIFFYSLLEDANEAPLASSL